MRPSRVCRRVALFGSCSGRPEPGAYSCRCRCCRCVVGRLWGVPASFSDASCLCCRLDLVLVFCVWVCRQSGVSVSVLSPSVDSIWCRLVLVVLCVSGSCLGLYSAWCPCLAVVVCSSRSRRVGYEALPSVATTALSSCLWGLALVVGALNVLSGWAVQRVPSCI